MEGIAVGLAVGVGDGVGEGVGSGARQSSPPVPILILLVLASLPFLALAFT